jgi:hypothetical protein
MRRFVPRVAVLLFGSLMVFGCGSSDPHNRQAVSGTVAYKGKPVVYGTIEFVPSENQPTALTLEIKDGKFAVDKKGGLAPGKYLIRVEGFDAPPPPPPDIPGTPVKSPTQLLPARYNTASQESVTVQAGEKNEFSLSFQ